MERGGKGRIGKRGGGQNPKDFPLRVGRCCETNKKSATECLMITDAEFWQKGEPVGAPRFETDQTMLR